MIPCNHPRWWASRWFEELQSRHLESQFWNRGSHPRFFPPHQCKPCHWSASLTTKFDPWPWSRQQRWHIQRMGGPSLTWCIQDQPIYTQQEACLLAREQRDSLFITCPWRLWQLKNTMKSVKSLPMRWASFQKPRAEPVRVETVKATEKILVNFIMCDFVCNWGGSEKDYNY